MPCAAQLGADDGILAELGAGDEGLSHPVGHDVLLDTERRHPEGVNHIVERSLRCTWRSSGMSSHWW